ncbi:MAG: Gfo/Idh/MocA family oxidoreductase [Armatimonadetes bacterium]|nr:Gfo/Idh/MocA family oxidoreductase [Armatimonadota bacterium]
MGLVETGKTVRLALIGAGGIAGAHLRGYAKIKEVEPDKFEIVAICDPVIDRAKEFAAHIAAFQGKEPRTYPDHEALLKAEKATVTPPTSPPRTIFITSRGSLAWRKGCTSWWKSPSV